MSVVAVVLAVLCCGGVVVVGTIHCAVGGVVEKCIKVAGGKVNFLPLSWPAS